jgi:hypothetical protein
MQSHQPNPNPLLLKSSESVQVKLTDEISYILNKYEEARPKDLAQSYTVATDNADPSLAVDMLNGVTEGAAIAAVGTLAGWRGVLVGAAYGAAKRCIDWFNKDNKKELTTYNLHYLKPLNLNKKNSTVLTEQEQKEISQIYDITYQYQLLKGSRFGVKILNIGEHRDDNVIDDPKYLLNIFIGRKLKAISEAKQEEVGQQKKHLSDFLDKCLHDDAPEIIKNILSSNSADTDFLSLRTVINTVQKYLKNDKKSTETSDHKQWFAILNQQLPTIKNNIADLNEHFKKRFTHLTCEVDPDKFRRYNNRMSANENATDWNDIKTVPYHSLLAQYIWNEDHSEINKSTFIEGLKKYINNNSADTQVFEKAYEKFVEIIKTKNELSAALKLLQNLHGIIGTDNTAAANLVLSTIIPHLQFLLEKIKNTELALSNKQDELVLILEPTASKSKNQIFKNAFTRYGFTVKTPVDLTSIHEALLALYHLSINTDLKEKVSDDLTAAVEKFKKDVIAFSGLGTPDNTLLTTSSASSTTATSTATSSSTTTVTDNQPADKMDDNLMQSWIILREQSEKAIDEHETIDQEYEEKKKYWMEQKIAELEKSNETLQGKVNTLETQLQQANKDKDEANKQLAELIPNEAASKIKEAFNQLIEHYKNYSRESHNLFYHHGAAGLKAARDIKTEFLKISDANLSKMTADNFKTFLSTNQNILKGNYSKHSLKSYLLAFYQYLNNSDNASKKFNVEQCISTLKKDNKDDYLQTIRDIAPVANNNSLAQYAGLR